MKEPSFEPIEFQKLLGAGAEHPSIAFMIEKLKKHTWHVLTLRRTVKLTFVFLRNMLKYVTVKSCIFCSKLQYSDDHHFVNKKTART